MREIMLILHFVGLVMGLGTSFAHAFLSIVTSKMTEDETTKFRLQSLVLSKMGNIGIILLVVSGLYLITPYWKTLPSNPLLMLKLALVAVVITLIILINTRAKKARKGDPIFHLERMEKMGKFTLMVGLAIVVIAVSIFH